MHVSGAAMRCLDSFALVAPTTGRRHRPDSTEARAKPWAGDLTLDTRKLSYDPQKLTLLTPVCSTIGRQSCRSSTDRSASDPTRSGRARPGQLRVLGVLGAARRCRSRGVLTGHPYMLQILLMSSLWITRRRPGVSDLATSQDHHHPTWRRAPAPARQRRRQGRVLSRAGV